MCPIGLIVVRGNVRERLGIQVSFFIIKINVVKNHIFNYRLKKGSVVEDIVMSWLCGKNDKFERTNNFL